MTLFFQNHFVSLSYDVALRLGSARWNGRLHSEELREAYLLCHEMINRFSLTRWLADDRLMGEISSTDLKWGLEVHVPRMARSSLLKIARIPSQYEKNRLAVDTMINKGYTYGPKLILRDFNDEHNAMEWLLDNSEILSPQRQLVNVKPHAAFAGGAKG
jgi:hypothetical protein